jgi:hypothetical protein
LSYAEKQEVFDVFYRVGHRMGLKGLPVTLDEWLKMRKEHLQQDLAYGKFTADLFKQYKRQLGPVRYAILREGQILVVPDRVRELLKLRPVSFLTPAIVAYKLSRSLKLDGLIKSAILPKQYHAEIRQLDMVR